MSSDWIDILPSSLDDADRDLVSLAAAQAGCDHPQDVRIAHLRSWPRALRITCEHCGRSAFIKRFDRDPVPNPEERRRRFDIERRNLTMLAELGFAEGDAGVPTAYGFIDKPHFALVERYYAEEPLLATIRNAISSGNPDAVHGALRLLAQFLVRLHEAPRGMSTVAPGPLPSFSSARDLLSAVRPHCCPAAYKKLSSLLTAWEHEVNDALSARALVHDGLTPVNILYGSETGRLVVTDLETVHHDTPFADVGTVSAELKLSYALHHGNPFAAEPLVSHFLRQYFSLQTALAMSFADFSYYQAFFMGRRLLMISTGVWLDPSIRQWALQTAQDVWSLVETRHDSLQPRFAGTRAVVFDFYNTIVSVHDDEWALANFRAVRDYLVRSVSCSPEALPDETWLREQYAAQIRRMYESSREPFPDVDLEVVWSCVLGRVESGVPLGALYAEGRRLVRGLLEVFRTTAVTRFEPFEGVIAVIQQLRKADLRVGIISDAQPAYVISEIGRAGLFGLLDCLILSGDFRYRKPDGRLFLDALERIQVRPSEAVFVGDDFYRDIYGAQQVGMRTVYKYCPCTADYYGTVTPDAVIREYRELPSLFGLAADETEA